MKSKDKRKQIGAVIAAVLTSLGCFYLAKFAGIRTFWAIFWPLVALLGSYQIFISLWDHWTQYERISELPDLKYPIKALIFRFWGTLILWIQAVMFFSGWCIGEGGTLYRLVVSTPFIFIALFLMVVLSFGGGQPILTKRKEGRIIRDQLSESFFSRQDFFYSLTGTWRDGIILGFESFTYKGMESVKEERALLTVRGEEAGERYLLMIYNKTNRKFYSDLLKSLECYQLEAWKQDPEYREPK